VGAAVTSNQTRLKKLKEEFQENADKKLREIHEAKKEELARKKDSGSQARK
jgi:hypothetical protein